MKIMETKTSQKLAIKGKWLRHYELPSVPFLSTTASVNSISAVWPQAGLMQFIFSLKRAILY